MIEAIGMLQSELIFTHKDRIFGSKERKSQCNRDLKCEKVIRNTYVHALTLTMSALSWLKKQFL